MEDLKPLSILPMMSAQDLIALVRAARMYQDSLWIAESETAMAWLLMVSAIECAANRWDQRAGTTLDRFQSSKPELASVIRARCPDLLEYIADELADSMGATRKFVEFLLHFLPDGPAKRPPEAFQVPWTGEGLKPLIKKIYDYRSKALHSGIPFPAPICDPPQSYADSQVPAERPFALAPGALGGVWLAKDLPMYLHLFEYLARGALLNWWQGFETQKDKI